MMGPSPDEVMGFLCELGCVLNHFVISVAVSSFVPKKGFSPPGKGVTGMKSSRSTRSSMRNDITMMPIGVPKVAYRVPGGAGAEW